MRRYSRRPRNTWLSHTVVRRRGVTAKEWYGRTDIVIASRPKGEKADARALTLYFTLPSKGGGVTEIEVLISPQDFPDLVALMSDTDQEAALQAMAEELRYQICEKAGDPLLTSRHI